ncbi:recombination protein O N-terminal domain-containing protein [Candidatus Parcubacteria bacterium]|nr:recombination protein O N-terminal domain-containing protein [Candidatus Parcubacteria bacterium]
MSYHIYTTKGIVLGAWPLREADRTYSILTRDLGLVRASASGVRKEESKLRGALEPFVLSSVSLVRGKEYWRITSAETLRPIPAEAGIGRPLALLEKLVQGEAAHPELFDAVETHLFSDEWRLVAHILYHLGYLKEEDLGLDKAELIKAINSGLHQSQLA